MEDKIFNIIELVADTKSYIPNSMKKEDWMEDNWVKQSEIDIPLGHSRYGGCVVDLPEGTQIPENMKFAGQLDLSIVSKFDETNLLPKTGQLLFFANLIESTGKVIYRDVENSQLKRVVEAHEDNFFVGVLIKAFHSGTESLSDYYKEPEEELECWECDENILNCNCTYEGKKEHIAGLELNADGKSWDCFEGSDRSKIFGVYTHCQTNANERLEVMNSEIVLLQIGENGFNDEGVFNVLIKEEDLKNKNFDRCILEWAQS